MPAPTLDKQFEEKQLGSSELRAPVELQWRESGDQADGRPVQMLARSSRGVPNYYWGMLYHDFAGMTVPGDSIPIDYCHREDELIGTATKFDVGDAGLVISGELVSTEPGDRADTVYKQSKRGIPFQASIDFRGDDVTAEEVPAGRVAQVNGETIQGPALIFRQWTLRGVAICPHGKDRNTSAQMSQDNASAAVVRIFTEDPMTQPQKPEQQHTEKPAATPEAQKPKQQQTEKPAADPKPKPAQQQTEQTDEPAPPTLSMQQWREDLKKYTDRFGLEHGARMFQEGKTYAEALESYCNNLAQQLSEKDSKIEQLSETLKSLNHGEDIPAAFNQDPADSPDGDAPVLDPQFSQHGGIGTFAASLKLPGAKAA